MPRREKFGGFKEWQGSSDPPPSRGGASPAGAGEALPFALLFCTIGSYTCFVVGSFFLRGAGQWFWPAASWERLFLSVLPAAANKRFCRCLFCFKKLTVINIFGNQFFPKKWKNNNRRKGRFRMLKLSDFVGTPRPHLDF